MKSASKLSRNPSLCQAPLSISAKRVHLQKVFHRVLNSELLQAARKSGAYLVSTNSFTQLCAERGRLVSWDCASQPTNCGCVAPSVCLNALVSCCGCGEQQRCGRGRAAGSGCALVVVLGLGPRCPPAPSPSPRQTPHSPGRRRACEVVSGNEEQCLPKHTANFRY